MAGTSYTMSTQPWSFFCEETQRNIRLNFKLLNHDRKRKHREDRAQQALDWSTQLPSVADEADALSAGIGNWVIALDKNAHKAIKLGYEYLVDKSKSMDYEQTFNLLRKLKFIQLDRSHDSANQRIEGIQNEQFMDLPIQNVRLVRTRVIFIQRQAKITGFDSKPVKVAINRALKLLACGLPFEREKTNTNTGEVYTERSLILCRVKGCANPECSYTNWSRRNQKLKADLSGTMANLTDEQKIVYVTFTTNWELPPDEEKFNHNRMNIIGRMNAWLNSSIPSTDETKTPDLLATRIETHKTHIRKFLDRKETKLNLLSVPTRVLEVAYLASSHKGRRYYPNPHTHMFAVVHKDTPASDLQATLSAIAKKVYAFADVLVSEITSISKATSYNSKADSVSHDGIKDVTPTGIDVTAIIDDRSLLESIRLDDSKSFPLIISKSFSNESDEHDVINLDLLSVETDEIDAHAVFNVINNIHDQVVPVTFSIEKRWNRVEGMTSKETKELKNSELGVRGVGDCVPVENSTGAFLATAGSS